MFPQSDSGEVDRDPIFPSDDAEFSFSVADSLYPYSEDNLKYELYRHLSDYGRCYCEVQLIQDEAEAIDIIWMDGKNNRRVGIEVKTPKGLNKNGVRQQLSRYRDRTLSDLTGESSVLTNDEHRDLSDFYVLDELWVATYQEPRINSNATDNEVQFDELGHLIDGHIQFDDTTGKYKYNIKESKERETLWKKNISFDNLTEPESPYVARLYKHFRNKGCIVTAEAPFAVSSERDITSKGVDRVTTRRADLVVTQQQDITGTFDCENTELRAIEVKGEFNFDRDYIEQLKRYHDSEIFTHIDFVFPTDFDTGDVKNDLPVDSEEIKRNLEIGGYGYGRIDWFNEVLSELPSTGIICLPEDNSNITDCVRVAESGRIQLNNIPLIKFYTDGDRQWYGKC